MVVVQSGVQFSFVCQVLEEIGWLQSRRQICFLQVLQGEKSHGLAKSMEKTKQNRIKKCIISSPMVNNSQNVPNELTQNIQFSIENFWIFFRNLTIMQAHQPGKKLYLPFCQSWLWRLQTPTLQILQPFFASVHAPYWSQMSQISEPSFHHHW